jgi:hypothetical protein
MNLDPQKLLSKEKQIRGIFYFEKLLPLDGTSNLKKKKYETFQFCKIDQFFLPSEPDPHRAIKR